jgi:hypothetical protein
LAYIVVYNFIDGEPVQRSKAQLTYRQYIQDIETQTSKRIKLKDLTNSHETLGTYQNPAGNPNGQMQALATKEARMRQAFLYMSLPVYKVHLAYHAMYTKSLQFALRVTLMSYEAANKV